MRCASCGFDNRAGAKFCNECGTPLMLRCASCGTENPGGAKFCSECGTALTGRQKAKGETAKGKTVEQRGKRRNGKRETTHDSRRQTLDSRLEGERRQLTVMFCDLVGSTALSAQLDPEELREVVRAYQEVSAEVITRFEGHIAQYLGDGLLVYFGYPAAHEDDAQRAVRAGLAIIGAMQEMPRQLRVRLSHPLQVRIGIHTGLVVVGEMGGGGKREQLALGETPNIAARIQEIAEPDAVVVSGTTYRLIQGLFDCRDLGAPALKGLSTPLQVYRVLGESAARSRLEVAVATGLTPLVGREEEIGLLLKRWEQATEGRGQVVLLSGEAGIGKSRLLQVLKERVATEPHTRLECSCAPYYQNTALYPVIELLQRVLRLQEDESSEEKLRKLEGALTQYDFALSEVVPLVAALLSLPQPEHYPPLALTPQKQKEKTQQAVLAWLLKEAERQPVRFGVEDLHWADPSTLEFLGLLIDQAPMARFLIVLTFRPEFLPPWPSRSHVTPIMLSRLVRTQAEVMSERVTGGKALPVEVFQQIVSKTDGVPLFIEELTKMVVESGLVREVHGRYELTGPLPPLAIPTTLQDSLMARLDRLATVKEVAQVGATLGREFSYELLRAVSPVPEASLQQALHKLVEAEVLYQRGLGSQTRYLFKHALIQDAVYQSLLKSTRQQYHRQIAHVLEERFPEVKEAQPELLAYHYTEAGLITQAIPYWQQAGQRAVGRSANSEAISHLTRGLELLKTLPDTPERAQYELALQTPLGASLGATRGFSAPETGRAYARARELCRQVGETPQLFPVLVGLCAFYEMQGELQTACDLGEQLLRLAQNVHDPTFLLWAHYLRGDTLFWLGEFAPAQAHVEQSITFYDPQKHRSLAFHYGVDPTMACYGIAGLALWHLGYPDQTLQSIRQALTLAQELAHPLTLASALNFAALLHQLRREGQLTQERTEAAITLATDQGFPNFLALGTIFRGWALAEQASLPGRQGQAQEGISQIHQGIASWRASGAEVRQSSFLALLSEAYEKVGQAEKGLAVLAEALTLVHKTGERFSEAELYRLKGELLLNAERGRQNAELVHRSSFSVHRSAEECFLKAIEIAHRQQAKSLELRAVMSMSRLWQQQGKRGEARQLLAEIYGWFTEGFDTKDLQAAKMLLELL